MKKQIIDGVLITGIAGSCRCRCFMPSITRFPERSAVWRFCALFKLPGFFHGVFSDAAKTSERTATGKISLGVPSNFHIMQGRECAK
jgi:hypothetical protein